MYCKSMVTVAEQTHGANQLNDTNQSGEIQYMKHFQNLHKLVLYKKWALTSKIIYTFNIEFVPTSSMRSMTIVRSPFMCVRMTR